MEYEYIVKVYETWDSGTVNKLIDLGWLMLSEPVGDDSSYLFVLGWDKRYGTPKYPDPPEVPEWTKEGLI